MSLAYKVEYSQEARKQLKVVDRQVLVKIKNWIESRLINCENPRLWGGRLTGSPGEKWRYLIGDYRVLCLIKDNIVTVQIVSIGYRKEIYKE